MAGDTFVFDFECEPFFQVARKHERSTTLISNKLTLNTLPGHRGVAPDSLAVVGADYNEGVGLPVAPTVKLLGTEAVL